MNTAEGLFLAILSEAGGPASSPLWIRKSASPLERFPRPASSAFGPANDVRRLIRPVQKFAQPVLPKLRVEHGNVAACVFAGWDQEKVRVFNAGELFSVIPVSGGLRSSSAELIARTRAVILSKTGDGS